MDARDVHGTIGRFQLADGLPLVVDLERSHGVYLRDELTGDDFIDAFSCFAAWPIGFNHHRLKDPVFHEELLRAASTKLTNSDLYSRELARFVEAFATRVTPPGYDRHFWISGGSLAVENALKAAFDWKARRLGRHSYHDDVNDLVIMHLQHAFHGRSGYTLSLTNTGPEKIGLFPKFAWPRIPSPALEVDHHGRVTNDIEAEERHALHVADRAFARHADHIAAIIVEPMQSEGGDRHLRPAFLQALRDRADEHDALLIFDEVQTGFHASGRTWLWQELGVRPDLVAFGKKSQVCGVYASERIDEVPDNVFRTPGRINSTWGGNLVDMVRCRKIIEIVDAEDLNTRTTRVGDRMVRGLRRIAGDHPAVTNPRGVGSLIAFTLPDAAARDRVLAGLFEARVLALPCGPTSVRFRLPLIMTEPEADELLDRAEHAIAFATPGALTA
jgi:L-lysine 6-transaminase